MTWHEPDLGMIEPEWDEGEPLLAWADETRDRLHVGLVFGVGFMTGAAVILVGLLIKAGL